MEKIPFCRRCLLEDFGESDLLRSIQEYIALLPESERAAPEAVHSRQNLCRSCVHLQNGMCSLCGCFVEARTAKVKQSCPDSPPKW